MSFLKEAVLHPRSTGALLPSSVALSRRIVREADISTAHVVVELGPGTGVFTKEIERNISADAVYIGIEKNKVFVEGMQKKYPELCIIHGDATHLKKYLKERGLTQCDRIVSGLPWAAFSSATQDAILSEIDTTLAKGGVFVTFAYFPFNYLQQGKALKRKLSRHFTQVTQTHVVANFPPAFIYVCKKA